MSLFKSAEPKAPETIMNPEELPATEAWNEARGADLCRLMKAYRRDRGEEAVLEEVKNFFDPWLLAGLPEHSVPDTLPMLAMTLLYEENHDQALLAPIREWAEWLMTEAPRDERTGVLLDAEGNISPRTVPLALLFLYRAGFALEKEAWRSEARYQLLMHAQLLWDEKTGLWQRTAAGDRGENLDAESTALVAASLADWKEWLTAADPVRRLAQLIWERTAPQEADPA